MLFRGVRLERGGVAEQVRDRLAQPHLGALALGVQKEAGLGRGHFDDRLTRLDLSYRLTRRNCAAVASQPGDKQAGLAVDVSCRYQNRFHVATCLMACSTRSDVISIRASSVLEVGITVASLAAVTTGRRSSAGGGMRCPGRPGVRGGAMSGS